MRSLALGSDGGPSAIGGRGRRRGGCGRGCWWPSRPELPRDAPPGTEAVVVGAGVAGVSAAVVLAERGVAVTLLEAAPHPRRPARAPGRTPCPDGTEQVVEHGFHAFFRHYYTWRAVLRRIDPELGFLRPVGGYPVISRQLAAGGPDRAAGRARR